jgi:hypothetical protein
MVKGQKRPAIMLNGPPMKKIQPRNEQGSPWITNSCHAVTKKKADP